MRYAVEEARRNHAIWRRAWGLLGIAAVAFTIAWTCLVLGEEE